MGTSDRKPWEIISALQAEYLRVIATILWHSRNLAAEDLRGAWKKGMTRWGLGCLAFEYSTAAISRAAASGEFPWLSILDHSSHFVFAVNGAPFRFYRGDSEKDAPERHSLCSDGERRQLDMVLGDVTTDDGKGVLRMVVSATSKGHSTGVMFARVTEDGTLHDEWMVPLLTLSRVTAAFRFPEDLTSQEPAATMPAPSAKPKGDPKVDEQKPPKSKGA